MKINRWLRHHRNEIDDSEAVSAKINDLSLKVIGGLICIRRGDWKHISLDVKELIVEAKDINDNKNFHKVEIIERE